MIPPPSPLLQTRVLSARFHAPRSLLPRLKIGPAVPVSVEYYLNFSFILQLVCTVLFLEITYFIS